MQMVVICEAFGWTYQQYHEQPLPFLNLIKEKMRLDAQRNEKERLKRR